MRGRSQELQEFRSVKQSSIGAMEYWSDGVME
jgi:hypothetical protein